MPAKPAATHRDALTEPPAAPFLANNMQLCWVALDELKAFGRKTRSHTRQQISKLADSMGAFGFSVPILVDDDNRILAGHARLEAARLAGLDKAPVVVLSHLTAEQKRAFIIAENRLAELSGWDKDALRIELQELSELDLNFDLEVIGFEDVEIDAIVFSDAAGAEPAAVAPPSLEAAVSARGDLWVMGEHRLYCGDALEPESLDRLLQGEEVRTVFTDPPYNVPISGHVTGNKAHGEFVMATGEMTDEQFTAFLRQVWRQAERALTPGGLAYLCMDWRHMNNVLAAYDPAALDLMNLIVWDKTAGGMGSFLSLAP